MLRVSVCAVGASCLWARSPRTPAGRSAGGAKGLLPTRSKGHVLAARGQLAQEQPDMVNGGHLVLGVQRKLLVLQPKRRRGAPKAPEDGSVPRSRSLPGAIHGKAGLGRACWIRPWTQAPPRLQPFPSAFNEVLAVLGINEVLAINGH